MHFIFNRRRSRVHSISIQFIPFYIFLELMDGDTLVVQPAGMQA